MSSVVVNSPEQQLTDSIERLRLDERNETMLMVRSRLAAARELVRSGKIEPDAVEKLVRLAERATNQREGGVAELNNHLDFVLKVQRPISRAFGLAFVSLLVMLVSFLAGSLLNVPEIAATVAGVVLAVLALRRP